MSPKNHTTPYSLHSLFYCSGCDKHSRKQLIKSFLIQNPGLSRSSLRLLIKQKKVLVHRHRNHFYVTWNKDIDNA